MGAATAQVHIEQHNNVVDLMSLNCIAEKKATIILHINQADKINYCEFNRIVDAVESATEWRQAFGVRTPKY